MKKIAWFLSLVLMLATFGFSVNETRVIAKEVIARDRLISYGTAELESIDANNCTFAGDVSINGTLKVATLSYTVSNAITTNLIVSGSVTASGNGTFTGSVAGNSLQINGNSIMTGISTINSIVATTINGTNLSATIGTITGLTVTNLTPTNINSSGTATLNRAIISSVNITTANIGNISSLGSLTMTGALQVGTTLRVIGEAVYDKSITLNEELKFASLNGTIKTGSADGADNRSLTIAGASVGATRGSSLTVYGNEHAGVGSAVVQLGNNAGAYFKVKNGAGVEAIRIDGLTNAISIGTANIGVLNTTVNISNLITTTVNATRVSGNNFVATRIDAITVSFNDFLANGTSTMNIVKAGAITGTSYTGGNITGATVSGSALQINGNSIFTGYGNFGGVVSSIGTMNYSITTRNATVSTGNIDIPIIIKGVTYYLKATQ